MYLEGFEAEGLIQREDSAASDTPTDYGPGDFAAGGISEVTLT